MGFYAGNNGRILGPGPLGNLARTQAPPVHTRAWMEEEEEDPTPSHLTPFFPSLGGGGDSFVGGREGMACVGKQLPPLPKVAPPTLQKHPTPLSSSSSSSSSLSKIPHPISCALFPPLQDHLTPSFLSSSLRVAAREESVVESVEDSPITKEGTVTTQQNLEYQVD